jgi:DNA-binding response OmpR family regulator
MAIRVLLVEDDVFLGELISEALVRQSVEVTWFVRARKDTDDSRLIFMDRRRGVSASLKPTTFDSALVDYRLKCSVLTGPEVVQELSPAWCLHHRCQRLMQA